MSDILGPLPAFLAAMIFLVLVIAFSDWLDARVRGGREAGRQEFQKLILAARDILRHLTPKRPLLYFVVCLLVTAQSASIEMSLSKMSLSRSDLPWWLSVNRWILRALAIPAAVSLVGCLVLTWRACQARLSRRDLPDVAFFLFNSDLISAEKHGNYAEFSLRQVIDCLDCSGGTSPVNIGVMQFIQGDLLGEQLLGDLGRNVSEYGEIGIYDLTISVPLERRQDVSSPYIVYCIGVWADQSRILVALNVRMSQKPALGYIGHIRLGQSLAVEDFLTNLGPRLALPIDILIAKGRYHPDSRTLLSPNDLNELGLLPLEIAADESPFRQADLPKPDQPAATTQAAEKQPSQGWQAGASASPPLDPTETDTLHDVQEFVQQTANGPIFLRTRISAIPVCYDLLARELKGHGQSSHEVIETLSKQLRGICPLCTAWTYGETLGNVWAHDDYRRNNIPVSFSDYGDTAHLLDAHCIAEGCSSSEILLIWGGDPSTEATLADHLTRLRSDAENSGNATLLQCAQSLASPELFAFATDAGFALSLGQPTEHRWVGRGFGSVPNFVVYVSFIPGDRQGVPLAFPDGYFRFFNMLLGKSDFTRGDRRVAHWIHHTTEGRGLWSLALAADYKQSTEYLLLPHDLLSEQDERSSSLRHL